MGDPRVASFDQSSADFHAVFGDQVMHDPVTGLQRTRPAATIGTDLLRDEWGDWTPEHRPDAVQGVEILSGVRGDWDNRTPEFVLGAANGVDADDFFDTFEMGGE